MPGINLKARSYHNHNTSAENWSLFTTQENPSRDNWVIIETALSHAHLTSFGTFSSFFSRHHFFHLCPSPTFVPVFLLVLLLQEGRVWVGGGGARLCRYISPPAGSLQSQHCGGYSRRLLHPKWPCPFFHPSNGQETDTIADLLPILYTLWDAFLPPATSAAAPPPTRWVEERRGPDQLSQCPAAGSGPASACKHFKLS